MSNARCHCGGGRAHHENDFACWCPRCLQRPAAERCTDYAPRTPLKLPTPPARSHKRDSLPVSNAAEPKPNITPTRSEPRDLIARQVAASADAGSTCGELATLLNLSTKTVATQLALLSDNNEITRSPTPRTLGDVTEDVWLAVGHERAPDPHQASLWA